MVSTYFRVAISLIFIFIIGALVWLILSVNGTSEKLNHSIENQTRELILQQANQFTKILISHLKDTDKNLPLLLKKDTNLQQILNENLEVMRNNNSPYIYLLFLDKNSKFRYLADGSEKKSHFYQKFDPDNLVHWKRIYDGTQVTLLDQSYYHGLWKSMLIPIKYNQKNIALLVIDYSIKLPHSVNTILTPLKNFLILIFVAIVLLVLFIVIELMQIYLIKKKSYKDLLTGVYNRSFYSDISKRLSLERYHILMIDLDYFKKINDLYGHRTGDMALKHTTQIIKNTLHKKDFLIRFGGEEFVVLLDRKICKTSPENIAEIIRKTLEKTPLETEEFGAINIQASIGVNQKTHREKSFHSAIKNADIALYQAKKSGRNCVKTVEEFQKTEVNTKLYDFAYIRTLIENESLCCHFQPIFSNKNHTIVKYEVLVRLKDKEGKLIMPNDFLSLIWKTNVYQNLTKQIIEKSVQTFKNRKESFSINLGLQDILNEEIINIIKEIAHKEPQTVKRMGIEILEYDRFEDAKRLGAILEQLQALGISIILDDFGSGHSNFSIVEKLNFDEIKIDGSIVEHINTNKKTKALIELLADFAKKSNIKTTAEYISSKEIFDSISKIGISNLQGFYLGKPKESIL